MVPFTHLFNFMLRSRVGGLTRTTDSHHPHNSNTDAATVAPTTVHLKEARGHVKLHRGTATAAKAQQRLKPQKLAQQRLNPHELAQQRLKLAQQRLKPQELASLKPK